MRISVNAAEKDASAIYRRALAVADAYPDIAKAIASYRDAKVRQGKKAAASRKRKAKAGAPAPQAAAQTGFQTRQEQAVEGLRLRP